MLTPWKESYDQTRQIIKKQRHYFANKGPSSQGYGFSSGHVWMWELDYKESWALKNWCFWTVVLEKTLESLLDFKEIQPVQPKGDQFWVFTGRTDAGAGTPVLWPPGPKICPLLGGLHSLATSIRTACHLKPKFSRWGWGSESYCSSRQVDAPGRESLHLTCTGWINYD